jgi:lysophospholipase L1-like esterase
MSGIPRWLRGVGSVLRTAWMIVGIYLILVLGVEACSNLWLRVGIPARPIFNEANADALAGLDWARDYVREVRASRDHPQWRSYVYWRRRPYAGHLINIDEQGRRRTWQAPAGPGGAPAREIFVLGGSTVWGRGARDDFTIPSFLAKALADAGLGPLSVQNLGESGWVNTQGLIELVLELRRGNVPDLVVFYEGVNDVFSAYQNGEAGIPQNEARRRRAFESVQTAALLKALQRTSTYQVLEHYIGARRREASRGQPHPLPSAEQNEALARAVVATFAGNVRIVEALARGFGFQALFYWQPMVFTKSSRTPHEEVVLEEYLERYPGFDAFYALVRRDLAEDPFLSGHPGFRDLGGIFGDDGRAYYVDFAHVSEPGNEIIAGAIAQDVRARLGAPEP